MYPFTQPTAEERVEIARKAQEKAQAIVDNINSHLQAGRIVMMHSYTKSWQYSGEKHIGSFKAEKGHICVRQGRRWVIADGCKFQYYERK